MDLYDRADNVRPTLHDEVEKEAEKEYLEDIQLLYEQPGQDYTPQEHKHALHRTFRSFRIPGIGGADVDGYIAMVRPNVKTLVKGQVEDMASAKIQLSLWIMWKKRTNPEGANDEYIEVKKVSVFQGNDVDDVLDRMFAQIKTHVEHPALPQNGFSISRILHLDIDFHRLRLTRGFSYIELPKWIDSKKPVINRFEENNKEIAVNVLYITGKKINILRRSVHNGRTKVLTLLLITDDKKTHYTAVNFLSQPLGNGTSKNTKSMHFCLNCLQGFNTVESRDKHYRYCKDHEAVKITMPTEAEKWLYYRDSQQQFKVPLSIYADFESLIVPVEDAREIKTKKLNKHVPSGWCTYSIFAYGDVPDPLAVYRGEDCVTKFVNHLEDEVKRLYNTYPQQPMLPLTEVLKRVHHGASNCLICMKSFDDCENSRNCHCTGLYRGAAHAICNLRYKIPSHIPVIFHNLSGYDAHLLIRNLSEKYDTQDIGCIAENTEKYISFNVKIKVPLVGMGYGDGEAYKTIEIRFIDSCRLMPSSPDKLQRFEEVELSPKEAFYSKLNIKGISDDDYTYAQRVRNCITPEGDNVTLSNYHDVYLAKYVLLLADVFETFRDVCLTNYKLDPAHFYSAPGLAWKVALMYTRIRLELLTDPDMLLMFKKGIRGGITQAVHRYAKANNKYMGDQYDPEVESSYLQYLDANNLYGLAMRQDLPTDSFKWVSNTEVFTEKRIEKLVRDNKHGYILEVDIDYPERLHVKHNQLQFLPKRTMVHKVEKLVPNLENKRKYVVHIRALLEDFYRDIANGGTVRYKCV
ncbi:uncharacterized protein LOC130625189 [Hydractinia symbiolongicarpus]|uniref:uncharacterized protein LOC130625189 n=1 Tax=Hydractinia symbiolongicarpus TaxID=13093 RepID=UPI002549F4AA|nr:uncharacterized protein LOC130625189 [Hydractinia symbiolongicarpus]